VVQVGGSQRLADALASYLRSLGGAVETGRTIDSLDELPAHGPRLLDVTPHELLRLAGSRLPALYRRRLGGYRYGPGVFKLDWALDGPIPWRAGEVARAGTVHLGGTLEEIVDSEEASSSGRHHDHPYVLLVQQTPFDGTGAPEGKHTAWADCHVPSGSARDMTAAIEAQVERFAPGFRERVLARSAMGPGEVERRNPNYVGRRHQRRRAGPAPAHHPAGGAPRPVLDTAPGASTSARPRRRRAAGCTGCPATGRRGPR
jgi:phytoene dehydrogenase-like protein